jgi:hypothetical protein
MRNLWCVRGSIFVLWSIAALFQPLIGCVFADHITPLTIAWPSVPLPSRELGE